MGVLTNSIGIYTFDDLRGEIERSREQLQVLRRAGINSVAFRKTGQRTGGFQLLSIHYVLDWTTARNALDAYKTLIGADPQTVFQHSVNQGTYVVSDVVQTQADAVVQTIGAIVPGAQVRQVCQWTLWG